MNGLSLIPIFMIGLLGSVHCIGMCGGIVAALSSAMPRKSFPVQVQVSGGVAIASHAPAAAWLYVLAYNTGRIASYTTAGALAGGTARGLQSLAGFSAVQTGGYWLANLMLVALGLYLMGAWHGLAWLEKAGGLLWRRLQPLSRSLLPPDRPAKILAAGALWGWLPCGMVYSILLTAMLTGTAQGGAMVMLAFGLGTLPVLLMLGLLGTRLREWTRRPATRLACGLLVLGFGLIGLYRAAHGIGPDWLNLLCIRH